MKAHYYNIISTLALLVSYVPLLILIFRKLTKDLPLLIFSLYWVVGGFVNLMGFIPFVSMRSYEVISIVHNMLDVPFVLYIFLRNSTLENTRRIVRPLIPLYLFIEIVNGLVRGFTDESFKYFVGAGIIVILVIVLKEIAQYFLTVEHTPREKALILIYFAVLFEYASYIVCYVFTYFRPAHLEDVNIVYFTSSVIGVLIASLGFMSANLKQPPSAKSRPVNEVLIRILD